MATIISVWTSNLTQLKDLALQKTEGTPKNTLSVKASFGRNIDFKQFTDTFEDISEDTSITFKNVYLDLGLNNLEDKKEIVLEYFKSVPEWRYPILNGRDYTPQEVINGDKKILIGKNIDKLTYKDNNIKKINIKDTVYEVVGIVGRKNKKTPWDDEIFIPLKSAPENVKIQFAGIRPFSFLIKNNTTQPLKDCQYLKNKITGENASFIEKELDEKDDVVANIFAKNNDFTQITLTITILVLINMMNISIFWIDDRIQEIGIRKAFGMNNKQIIEMLSKELLSICIISILFIFILQLTFSVFIDNTTYQLNLTLQNCYSGIVISLISIIITMILPIYYILRIQPIEVLKGE